MRSRRGTISFWDCCGINCFEAQVIAIKPARRRSRCPVGSNAEYCKTLHPPRGHGAGPSPAPNGKVARRTGGYARDMFPDEGMNAHVGVQLVPALLYKREGAIRLEMGHDGFPCIHDWADCGGLRVINPDRRPHLFPSSVNPQKCTNTITTKKTHERHIDGFTFL